MVEVGERCVARLVKAVYGKKNTEADKLERNLVRSSGTLFLEQKQSMADGINRI